MTTEHIGVVLLSGGIDSSTLLAYASQKGHSELAAISFDYGQRHNKELVSARKIARHFGAKHSTKYINSVIGGGGLTDHSAEIPDKSYAELGDGVSPTYVPFRNGTLLSIAASQAHAMVMSTTGNHDNDGEFTIYYGAHADDAAGGAYPDCTVEFAEAIGNAIRIGTYGKGRLVAPFVTFTKDQIVMLGSELGVPWVDTWSCYRGEALHCGTCPTCQDRRMAFKKAGVEDPTKYRRDPEQIGAFAHE